MVEGDILSRVKVSPEVCAWRHDSEQEHKSHYSPVSTRVGVLTNISELSGSVKTHWYTPASEAANVKERAEVRRPLVPAVLVSDYIDPSLAKCPEGSMHHLLAIYTQIHNSYKRPNGLAGWLAS